MISKELLDTPRMLDAKDDEHNRVGGLIDLIKLVEPNSVLEIGACRGVSTAAFLHFADRVTVIDPWEPPYEGCYLDFIERVAAHAKGLRIIVGRSPNDLNDRAPLGVDLVYIDARHDTASVWNDLHAGWRHLAPGGYLAGHDWQYHTVRVAVAQFCELWRQELVRVFADQSWLIRPEGGGVMAAAA